MNPPRGFLSPDSDSGRHPDSLPDQYKIRKHDVGERALFVIDGLFDEPFIRMAHRIMRCLKFTLSDYDTDETAHVRHWKHEFELGKFGSIAVLPELVSKIVTVTNELAAPLKPELKRVHCNLHPYGDIQYPHPDVVPGDAGVTAVYFANPCWETNWMGETLFYDDDGDPLFAVFPKPGRVVVFSADIVHRGGVPSRNCFEPRISLALKFKVES